MVASTFLLCAILFILLSKKINTDMKELRKICKIPQGSIIYSDLNTPGKVLYSHKYRLSGKPDYIIKTKESYTPIELKSGMYYSPQINHIMQLAAYCLLIEENKNCFVPYGVLVYGDSKHTISFDPKLRFELEVTLKQMRESLKNNVVHLNHNDPQKCRSCSMNMYCLDKLS